LTYMILGGLLAIPYAVWSKRQLTLKQESGSEKSDTNLG
jgi:hypothetical protein